MLELFTQHDVTDKDQPRHRERKQARHQPAAEAKKLCLASVVKLVALRDRGSEARGYGSAGSAWRDGGSAGVGDGFRIGCGRRVAAHAATGFSTDLNQASISSSGIGM